LIKIIKRRLYSKRTFCGIVRTKSRSVRFGFRYGFIELGGHGAGIYLPRKDI